MRLCPTMDKKSFKYFNNLTCMVNMNYMVAWFDYFLGCKKSWMQFFRIQKKLLKHCNRNFKTVSAKKTKSTFVHVGM